MIHITLEPIKKDAQENPCSFISINIYHFQLTHKERPRVTIDTFISRCSRWRSIDSLATDRLTQFFLRL